MKIIKDLQECKKLWDKYSPKETLWDETEFVFSLYDSEIQEPHFIETEYGLIPLEYNKLFKKFYFFGSPFPEARKLWFDKSKLMHIYELLPNQTTLFDIKHTEISEEHSSLIQEEDHRYFLDLEKTKTLEQYLSSFNKKHRKNLKYDIEKIMKEELTMTWTDKVNYDKLIEFSIKRFGNESDFYTEESRKETKKLIESIPDKILCVTLFQEEELVGLMFSIYFNDVLYVINGSNDYKIKNLGKVLILETIKKGFELKAKEVNFLVGSNSWKELWNLEKEKVVTIKKP